MTITDTKRCIACGAEFTRSRTDSTVRCPACRATRDARRGDDARRIETCVCGKTVVATFTGTGERHATGVTCPRECDKAVA